MTDSPKERFPKKKPVEELPDEEVMKRLFPKKVRTELNKIAQEQRPEEEGGEGESEGS